MSSVSSELFILSWLKHIYNIAHLYLQDMLINCLYALMYFCLAIPMAMFSDEWKNLDSTFMGSGESGDIPVDVGRLSDSLATASVRYSYLSIPVVNQ